jgi:UrcA family protein
MKTRRLRFPIALAAALAGLSTAASASEVSFRFHADDLTDPSSLYERMADAAAEACETSGRRGLWSARADAACAADLLDDFVADAGSAALAAIHAEETEARVAALR